jgi:hypothetical protein
MHRVAFDYCKSCKSCARGKSASSKPLDNCTLSTSPVSPGSGQLSILSSVYSTSATTAPLLTRSSPSLDPFPICRPRPSPLHRFRRRRCIGVLRKPSSSSPLGAKPAPSSPRLPTTTSKMGASSLEPSSPPSSRTPNPSPSEVDPFLNRKRPVRSSDPCNLVPAY